jgi:hypothetical protein
LAACSPDKTAPIASSIYTRQHATSSSSKGKIYQHKDIPGHVSDGGFSFPSFKKKTNALHHHCRQRLIAERQTVPKNPLTG